MPWPEARVQAIAEITFLMVERKPGFEQALADEVIDRRHDGHDHRIDHLRPRLFAKHKAKTKF